MIEVDVCLPSLSMTRSTSRLLPEVFITLYPPTNTLLLYEYLYCHNSLSFPLPVLFTPHQALQDPRGDHRVHAVTAQRVAHQVSAVPSLTATAAVCLTVAACITVTALTV